MGKCINNSQIWRGGMGGVRNENWDGGGADEVSWMYAPGGSAAVSRRSFIIHEGCFENKRAI